MFYVLSNVAYHEADNPWVLLLALFCVLLFIPGVFTLITLNKKSIKELYQNNL